LIRTQSIHHLDHFPIPTEVALTPYQYFEFVNAKQDCADTVDFPEQLSAGLGFDRSV